MAMAVFCLPIFLLALLIIRVYGRNSQSTVPGLSPRLFGRVIVAAVVLFLLVAFMYLVFGKLAAGAGVFLISGILLLWVAKNRDTIEKNMPMGLTARYVVLTGLILCYLAVVYYWLWGSVFYRLEISDNHENIHLVYLMPERIKSIKKEEVSDLSIEASVFPHGKSRLQVQIEAGENGTYRSRPFYGKYLKEIQDRLVLMDM